MKRYALLTLVFLPCLLLAQTNEEENQATRFIDHLYVGGDVGLQFTGSSSFFNLAPFAGYYITPDLSAGLGLHYQWTSYRLLTSSLNDTTVHDHVFGGSVFARYHVTDQFLVHAEYEVLNTKVFEPFTLREFRRNVPILMVGAGWRYRLGPQSYMQFLILYDVIDDPGSPYPEYFAVPILFRGGFIIELGQGISSD